MGFRTWIIGAAQSPTGMLLGPAAEASRLKRQEQRAQRRQDGGVRLPLLLNAANARLPRRRRPRSKNCANFRRFGPFLRPADAQAIVPRHHRHRISRTAEAEQALANEVRLVQAQIFELDRQHTLLMARTINARLDAVAQATQRVQGFYDMFGRGYRPPSATNPIQIDVPASYLRSLMHENVLCTEFQGVEMFLQQYRIGTESHSAFVIELGQVHVVSDENDTTIQIKADAVARMRISRVTLARFFPSIIQDENLVQQLIGKEYVMQYDKVFHFRDGRVFQHESRVDFGGGMVRLTQDPFVALKLLQASLMTKHGHWRIDNRIEEDRHELTNSML